MSPPFRPPANPRPRLARSQACRLFTLVAALALPVTAPAAAKDSVDPASVIAVLTADWNGDGRFDRAVLMEGGENEADLYLYLSSGADGALALAAQRPGLVWRGLVWGTLPELALNQAGSLQVVGMNDSVGRNRWRETFTIAHRGGEFVVAGYTFETHDTLDPTLDLACDVNFLTGEGVANGVPFRVDEPVSTLGRWSPAMVPDACAAG